MSPASVNTWPLRPGRNTNQPFFSLRLLLFFKFAYLEMGMSDLPVCYPTRHEVVVVCVSRPNLGDRQFFSKIDTFWNVWATSIHG